MLSKTLKKVLHTTNIQQNYFATMRAAVLQGVNAGMKIENIEIPKPRPGEALIKVNTAGVCHTDLHVIKGDVKFPMPAVMGHEISGEIIEINDPLIKRLKVGQRAIGTFIMPCGNCYQCDKGHDDICEQFFSQNRLNGTLYDGETRLYRTDGTPIAMYSMGGFAEYCVVPTSGVYAIPENIPYDESCIIGCGLFTAFGAIKNSAELQAGENVAVVGCGGVGSNLLQICRAFGANHIIAIDMSDEKLNKMKELGATHTINIKNQDPVAEIQKITNGRGVDVSLEAIGNPASFKLATMVVRDGGRAVMIGIAPAGKMAEVEITRLVRRKIQIRGSYGARARVDTPIILDMVSKGLMDTVAPITRHYTLDQINEAYDDLSEGRIIGKGIVKI